MKRCGNSSFRIFKYKYHLGQTKTRLVFRSKFENSKLNLLYIFTYCWRALNSEQHCQLRLCPKRQFRSSKFEFKSKPPIWSKPDFPFPFYFSAQAHQSVSGGTMAHLAATPSPAHALQTGRLWCRCAGPQRRQPHRRPPSAHAPHESPTHGPFSPAPRALRRLCSPI